MAIDLRLGMSLWHIVRIGARTWRRTPALAAVIVCTLALGIGACTAIFSVVDAVLWRSLPFPQAERIISVREVDAKGRLTSFAEPNFVDLRARNKTLSAAAEYVAGLVTILGGIDIVLGEVDC